MAAKWQPLSTDSTDPPLNPPLEKTTQIGRMAGSSLQNVGVGCQLHMKIAQRLPYYGQDQPDPRNPSSPAWHSAW